MLLEHLIKHSFRKLIDDTFETCVRSVILEEYHNVRDDCSLHLLSDCLDEFFEGLFEFHWQLAIELHRNFALIKDPLDSRLYPQKQLNKVGGVTLSAGTIRYVGLLCDSKDVFFNLLRFAFGLLFRRFLLHRSSWLFFYRVVGLHWLLFGQLCLLALHALIVCDITFELFVASIEPKNFLLNLLVKLVPLVNVSAMVFNLFVETHDF